MNMIEYDYLFSEVASKKAFMNLELTYLEQIESKPFFVFLGNLPPPHLCVGKNQLLSLVICAFYSVESGSGESGVG